MTALSAAPARRRGAIFSLSLLIAAFLAPVAFAVPAGAATLDNGSEVIRTGFAIDGNKTATGGTPTTFDWDDFLAVANLTTVGSNGAYVFTPTGPYTTADGYDSTGIVDGTFGWDNGTLEANCSKPDPTAFPGSVKPDTNPWVGGSTNVIPKANGCSFGNAHEIITDDDGVEHHILYQYWTRLEGNGDMTTYQTLEGTDAGRCDDYLVEFNYDPSTGTSVRVLKWVPTGGNCAANAPGAWSAISPNFPYQAAVGTRIEGPGLPAEKETFGEMAIDLTLAGLFDDDNCVAFQTSGYITRTGNSNTAELGDLVGGSDPLTLSNCGTISVTKAGLPADAADDTAFGYILTNGGADVHDDSLAGTDGTDDLTDLDAVDTSISGQIGFGETHTWGPVYSGEYAIAESIPGGSPWALWSLECTVDGTSHTIVDDGEPVEDAVIPVVVGQDTACVLTNATSALTVTKIVAGAETQSFAFDLDGDLTDSEIDLVGTTGGTTSAPVAYAPGSTVTVTELLGDLDWELTDVTCSDSTTGSDGSVTVTTTAGETVDCVFTNEQFGTIEVEKSTVGGDGTFVFELQPLDGSGDPVGDPIVESATTTAGSGTAEFGAFPAGSRFSIAEADAGDEWVPGTLECTVTAAGSQSGVALDESDFAIAPGDTISCAITNTATGTIIVVKNVTGTDDTFEFTGSWLTPDDFTIATTAGTGTTTFDDIVAGSYTLAEVLGDGYDGVALSCTESGTGDSSLSLATLTASLVLQPGETITCTYTNAEWGGLVVDKVTVPEGAEQSFDFEWAPVGETADKFALTDEGNAFSSGPIAPGDYVVTEKGATGWSLTGIVCTDPAKDDAAPVVAGASATVHVGLGETVTCTFTNAQRGPLEIDKAVAAGSPVNNGDGTWTITYDLKVKSYSNIPEQYHLTDALDFGAGIVPTSATVSSANGVTLNGGWNGVGDVVVATGATVPALGTHTYTVTVTAEVDAEFESLDAADCTVLDGEGTGFLNAGSITFWNGSDGDDACAPLPLADVTIVKDAPPGVDFEPEVGPTVFAYDLLVTNLGPATAEDVEVADPIKPGLQVVSATSSSGSCLIVANLVTCQLGDIPVGQSRTVKITVRMPVDYPIAEGVEAFTINNVATTSTTTPETDLTNNEDDADTTVFVTLALTDPDPDPDPDLPTLALTGAALGLGVPFAVALLAAGATALALVMRRRPSGRHTA